MTITATEVRKWLAYDAQTGELTWRIAPRNSILVGQGAGTLDNYGYLKVGLRGKKYRAHRLIWLYMTGKWPVGEIDHRDTDKLNNGWDNLRKATPSQQRQNMPVKKISSTGMKNVRRRDKDGLFVVNFRIDGCFRFFGAFATKEEAQAVARTKAKELYGEFAHD